MDIGLESFFRLGWNSKTGLKKKKKKKMKYNLAQLQICKQSSITITNMQAVINTVLKKLQQEWYTHESQNSCHS